MHHHGMGACVTIRGLFAECLQQLYLLLLLEDSQHFFLVLPEEFQKQVIVYLYIGDGVHKKIRTR